MNLLSSAVPTGLLFEPVYKLRNLTGREVNKNYMRAIQTTWMRIISHFFCHKINTQCISYTKLEVAVKVDSYIPIDKPKYKSETLENAISG